MRQQRHVFLNGHSSLGARTTCTVNLSCSQWVFVTAAAASAPFQLPLLGVASEIVCCCCVAANSGLVVPLLPFGMPKYDAGERFDLRSPYADDGWVVSEHEAEGLVYPCARWIHALGRRMAPVCMVVLLCFWLVASQCQA
jgi:hypothetical protein